MYYVIEVNLARKGARPVWQDLRDEDDDPITWVNLAEARGVLASENRGADARIACYVAGPEFPPVPISQTEIENVGI